MPAHNTKYYYLFLSALLFLIFWGFWQHPLSIYDEALYANNALEMSQTNDFFVLTLNYSPDLYNTKPPFAIWIMAVSIKIFGANEFAIRLPSVLAFILLVIILVRFSKKYFSTILPGVVAALILLGSQGFIITHGARSGDLDSLLVLFSTLFIFSCIDLLLSEKDNAAKALLNAGIFFTLSYFIKSTTILLFLPGLLACLFLSPSRHHIVREKLFLILPVVFLILIGIYYWAMNMALPGHFRQVVFSEYQRAFSDIMPWHARPFGWYIANMYDWRFTPFVFFLLPAIITGLSSKEKRQKKITIFLSLISLSYLLILSLVPDKLEWYDLPAYPLWALIIGIGINELVKRIVASKLQLPGWGTESLFIVLLAIPIFFTYQNQLKKKTPFEAEKPTYCIKEIQKEFKELKTLKVLLVVDDPLHQLAVDFYRKAHRRRIAISVQQSTASIHKRDTVLYTQAFFADSLKRMSLWPDTIYVCTQGVVAVIH